MLKTTIQIKSIGFSELEDNLRVLYSYKGRGIVDLEIFDDLKNSKLGNEAFFIQFIVTWIREFPTGSLFLPTNRSQIKIFLKSFCENRYGLVALAMTFRLRKIHDQDGEIEHETIREIITLYSIRMNDGVTKARKGANLMLACFDHSSFSKIKPFYNEIGEIREENEFKTLAKELFEVFGTQFYKISLQLNKYTSDVADLILELIDNTDKYAKKDLNQIPNKPNVRCLLAKMQYGKEQKFIDSIKNAEPLEKYLRNSLDKNTINQYLELSFVDSGPGLAMHYAARKFGKKKISDISLTEEYGYIQDCLKKQKTTDSSFGAFLKGNGLDKVMKILGDKGFMIIRSGRLFLYRDFFQDNFNDGNDDLMVRDWKTLDFKPTESHYTHGTLITIIYPL